MFLAKKPAKYLAHTQQFNLKNKGRPAWYASLRQLAITHLGRQIQLPFVARVYLLQGNHPALNKVAQSASKWHAAQTRVEFPPINGSPRIVHRNDASWRRACAACFALLNHLIHNALREAFHPRFFCFFFKPAFVGLYIFTFCRGLNPLETYGSITFCVGNRTPLPVIRLCHRHKSFPLWRNLQRLFFTVDLGLKYLKIKLKISYQPTKGKDFVLREFSIATHTIRYRIKII